MFDWDDIRLFLAVAQEGSTLGASKRLNINQTTVSRRIQALEQSLKLTLFERDPRGYAVTAHGSALLDLAGQMAASAETIQTRAERLSREVSGVIRLTGNPEAMEHWGSPCSRGSAPNILTSNSRWTSVRVRCRWKRARPILPCGRRTKLQAIR